MSMLDDIRGIIGEVFGDTTLFFADATLTRATASTGGWVEPTDTTASYPCKAMIESYSERLRVTADIPGTDMKLMIVGASISVDPKKGDTVTLNGRQWSLIQVDTDPARAMWACQARPV